MDTFNKTRKNKLALLTTFEQNYCNLSKYTKEIISLLDNDQLVILASEESKQPPEEFKNKNIIKCWNSLQSDFSGLFEVLNREQVRVLVVNCFQPFFKAKSFIPFINLCNLQGIEIIAEIDDASLIDNNLNDIIERLDTVIVSDSTLFPNAKNSASGRTTKVISKNNTRIPRILLQSRPNAYTQPGGDTVVMDRVSEGLRARGVRVDIDIKGEKDPKDYDIVNLYNFALKDHTESLAKNCVEKGVPYVVTTMYEDWPIFFNQMQGQYVALDAYIKENQAKNLWKEYHAQAKSVKPSGRWDNSFTANNSAALISTGENEATSLKRDYPQAKRVEIYHCGGEITNDQDNGELFFKTTGLRDFVFCVGRFELRKNQLMLLKALEDSDLTVVFAGGGFSYQPSYMELCKSFKRKGKTVFLDRLDPKMLSSAFQAAKIHVLPSWYELPGIVSIEAARLARNIVVTEYGTARDYFANYAFYCQPDEPETIYNAIMAAFYSPFNPELKKRVENYTWDAAAVRHGEIYQLALSNRTDLEWSFLNETRVQSISNNELVKQNLEQADSNSKQAIDAVKQLPQMSNNIQRFTINSNSMEEITDIEGETRKAEILKKDRKNEAALNILENILNLGNKLTKNQKDKALIIKAEALACLGNLEQAKEILWSVNNQEFVCKITACKGAILAAESNWSEARELFVQANKMDPAYDVPLAGIALCYSASGDTEQAWDFYRKAVSANPENLTAVYGIIDLGYKLNRLTIVATALENYLDLHPGDTNMLYSYAGCLYAQGKMDQALKELEKILLLQPSNNLAKELKTKILESPMARVGAK